LKKYASYLEAREALFSGALSCVELVNHYLEQIAANQQLNVFLDVYTEEATARAVAIDAKIAAGTAGKLAGMVVGIKDVLVYKDHAIRAGSKILAGFESQFTATAVQRLLDEDAIIIGMQNCDEFAMGSSNENSAYGPVLNAADNSRVPGGSSGGSAVAVQAGLCMASLGTDTGGSVRQPAAFCGVVGLKPTYSRISRFGLIAYASSFDCIGIFSTNVADNALILEVIAGEDEYDSTVSKKAVPAYSTHTSLDRKVRIAVIPETLESEGLNGEIRQKTEEIIARLKAEGHTVEEVHTNMLEYILPTYYILTTAEASSNLSRFDGVRYGYRTPNAQNLEEMYKKTRAEGFGEEVKRRIMLGAFVLSASYYDAFYTKAQKVRRMIKEETERILASYDFILMPTTPTTAFPFGAHSQDPIQMYLADIYTVQANICGLPAISIPVGKDSAGLPIGIQLMGKAFDEASLYAFSDYLMQKETV
jgi:aspartyl-tRNA(Asn)/glutamyl-tRNA(Gln) amidotransferase subunit A